MTERSSWTGGEFGFEADHAAAEEELRMKTAELYKDRVPRGRKGRDGDQRQNFRDDSRVNRRGGDERERRPVRQGGDRSDSPRGRDRAPRGEDDWSSFSSKPSSPDAGDDKEDDFFASLMSELTDDLSGSSSASEDGSRTRGTRHHDNAGPRPKAAPEKKPSGGDDDFFDSLMSELGGALEQPKPSPKNTNQKKASADDDDDDFFANLESELSSSMGNDFGDDDAFFDAFESEIKSNTKSTQGEEPDDFSDDDFFASLQQEMSESLNKSPESVDTALREDFLSSLIDDVADELESSNKDEANNRQHTPKEDSSQQTSDVSSLTVPELKDLLRSKGLKVGGKKAELIERLQGN